MNAGAASPTARCGRRAAGENRCMEEAAFWLIHQGTPVADMRNDPPPHAQTHKERRESWGNRSPFITQSMAASLLELGREASPRWPGRRLLESRVPTGSPTPQLFPCLDLLCLHHPLLRQALGESGYPLASQHLLLPACMITEPSPRRAPGREGLSHLGNFSRCPSLGCYWAPPPIHLLPVSSAPNYARMQSSRTDQKTKEVLKRCANCRRKGTCCLFLLLLQRGNRDKWQQMETHTSRNDVPCSALQLPFSRADTSAQFCTSWLTLTSIPAPSSSMLPSPGGRCCLGCAHLVICPCSSA